MTAPVSVVVITRDEEANIVRCLNSVRWASERIVVDGGSRDRTVALARDLGASVVHRRWPGYGPQKNFGIEQATQNWILSIDADEEVTPALATEIQETLSHDIASVAFRLHRPTFFMGKPLGHYGRAAHDPGFIRLFRKDAGRFDSRLVHETVQVRGTVDWLAHPLLHHSYPNLVSYWRKIHHYADLEARERRQSGQSRANRWVRAPGKLAWMLVWRRGLLDGPHAWLWIAGQAYQEWLSLP